MAGTVRRLQRQPFSSYIALQIGSICLNNCDLVAGRRDPPAIESLSISRASIKDPNKRQDISVYDVNRRNAANNNFGSLDERDLINESLFSEATFKLSTAVDNLLEKKILDFINSNPSNAEVFFKYGYVTGVKSFTYSGIIAEFSLSADGYSISLKVVPGGSRLERYRNFNQNTLNVINSKLLSKQYFAYSEVVQDIATLQGWRIGRIVPTQRMTLPITAIGPVVSDTPLSYIRTNLVPGSIALTGGAGFVAEFRISNIGNEEFYYRPSTYLVTGDYRFEKDYTFVTNMLPNGNVISWNPVMTNGVAAANHNIYSRSGDANSNIFGVISKDTKELTSLKFDISNSPKTDLLNASNYVAKVSQSALNVYADYYSVLNYAHSVIKGDISSYVYSTQMNPRASMTIIGDPELQLMDFINVYPMYPAKDNGVVMHPSGGTYQITKITDSISTSGYTTSVELTKQTEVPQVAASTTVAKAQESIVSKPAAHKVGDIVSFSGNMQYTSSYPGAKGSTAAATSAKITMINSRMLLTPGAHPYHLVHEGAYSPTNNLYGWVDATSIS